MNKEKTTENNRITLNPLVPFLKLLAKYLPKDKIALGFIIPFIFSILLFGIFQYYTPRNLTLHLKYGFAIYLIFVIWGFADTLYGKMRHRSALTGRRLSHLKELNFNIENIGDYWGYEGLFKNYFLRIYYDWFTQLSGQQFREVCIVLYFAPPTDTYGDLDESLLNSLNKKYKSKLRFAFYSVNFGAFFIALHSRYNIATTFADIQYRIEKIINIAIEDNLRSLSKVEVEKFIDDKAYAFAPSIETFVKAKSGTIN